MKITPEQLPQHLAQQRSALYLISGDDPLLTAEASLQIRQAFAKEGFADQLVLTPASESNAWEQLEQQLNQGLLFAEKQFIEVRMPDNKCPEKALATLNEFAKHPNPARAVLLVFSKLDSSTQKTKWFSELERHSSWVQLWPPRQYEYPQWLKHRCQQHGVALSADALMLLAEYTEGNLIAAAQAIEKLKLIATPTVIFEKQQLLAALNDESHYDLFDLTDALLAADSQRALHILRRLALQHMEPILVLWAITRQTRELLQYHQAMLKGDSIANILQKYRVMPQQRRLITSAMQKRHPKRWQQVLAYSYLIDKMIKGLHPGDTWLALEELCLLLIGIEVSLLSLQLREEFLPI